MSQYPYLLAAHIIFIITWFAALFYIVRLYIYHTEALQKDEPERSILSQQFVIMEKRLMQIIGTPSMVLVVITGSTLLSINSGFIYESWMQLKLGFIVCIIIYHFTCLNIQKRLAAGTSKLTSHQLRLFNELATLFLVSVVFLVELKNALNMLYGLFALIGFAILLMIGIKVYRKRRSKQ